MQYLAHNLIKFKLLSTTKTISLMTPHYFPEHRDLEKINGVYAGFVTLNDQHIIHVPIPTLAVFLNSVYADHKKIIFDNLYEGNIDIIVSRIHEALEIAKVVNPKNIYYMSGALNGVEAYQDFCERNSIPPEKMINIGAALTWEQGLLHWRNDSPYEIKNKEKVFLCFNRISRSHRFLLTMTLLRHDLVQKAFYSYFPENTYGYNLDGVLRDLSFDIKNTDWYNELVGIFDRNRNLFPMKLNIDPTYNKTFLDQDDIRYYAESYFSLVTETYFFQRQHTISHNSIHSIKDNHTIFLTEKTFKPIAMKHPFILVARPGSLAKLRELGYKTFSPFIDETYDTVEDDIERMNCITTEVNKLASKTPEEWIEWQQQIKDIVEHNYQVITTRREFYVKRNY